MQVKLTLTVTDVDLLTREGGRKEGHWVINVKYDT